eukprot:TRINITY_DN3647_c0_g1_i2.p1 TRINITY_DN3647_c0_g1~~TRINITY_DN3647_c0_g1_i2.p1  ORF type:complete len:192 (+),score=49.81 TRINITY_DN3647_c0_g1_i2:147-722(+)
MAQRVVALLGAVQIGAGLVLQQRGSPQTKCPLDYDVPDASGKPSELHLRTVANFMEPKVQDTFWNLPHVKEYYVPSDAFAIGPSKIAGCGAIAARTIAEGEKIGIVWVKDPDSAKFGDFAELVPRHFTPWWGRTVNHCDKSNSKLWEDENGSVWSVATKEILQGQEITGNYNEANQQFPVLVSKPDPSWSC